MDRWMVRRAGVADADLLADLAATTFPLACPPWMPAAAVEAHIRLRLSPDAFRINLADVDLEYTLGLQHSGRAVGYLLLARPSREPAEVAGLLELRQIYVRPELHGTGLADELLQTALERARQLGLPGVWLGTSKVNTRAIAFYRRHGFAVGGERVFLVDDVPNEDWVMIRAG